MLLIPSTEETDTAREKVAHYQPVVLIAAIFLLLVSTIVMTRKVITVRIGDEAQKHLTCRQTVADVLAELDLELAADDVVSPRPQEKVRTGMEIVLRRAFPVTVYADGKRYFVQIAEATVTEALAKLGLTLGESDRVEPKETHQLQPGDAVEVTRVKQEVFTQQTEIPFRIHRQSNAQLDRGVSQVAQAGITGLREDTVEVTIENGKEVSRKVIGSALLRVKRDEIVEYGENTLLARGGRELSFAQAYTVSVTAYCPGTAGSGCPIDSAGCSVCTGSYNDGFTATGRRAIAGTGSENNPHLVAVDPRVFPLGSKLYLDGYGFALAVDTGGAIKGHRLDLLMPTHQAALRFGRRQLRVYHLANR